MMKMVAVKLLFSFEFIWEVARGKSEYILKL